jgi:hypothetical protein
MSTVRQATWDLLRALGVRKVFGNPGSTELPFLSDFPDDIDYVLGLHEGAVVGMADAYAQSIGEPTLVNLHTAAGLGNAMGAIINAASGHSPLVITAEQRRVGVCRERAADQEPFGVQRPIAGMITGLLVDRFDGFFWRDHGPTHLAVSARGARSLSRSYEWCASNVYRFAAAAVCRPQGQ